MAHLRALAAGIVAAVVAAGSATAAPYTNLFVFGASESDSGNIYALTRGTTPPSPPYAQRYSNGPVAVEYFAERLGIPFTYSENPAAGNQGLNFAIGGSLTDTRNNVTALGNGYGIRNQVNDFQARVSSGRITFDPATTLFLIIGGGNDILRVGFFGSDPNTVVSNAVSSVSSEIQSLAALGAAHIALSTINDIGSLPTARPNRVVQYGQLSQELNAAYRSLAPTLAQSLAKDVSILDRGAILDGIIADYARYGFTDATTPCVVGTTVCSNPDQRVFWDSVHVTTRVHQLVGEQLADLVSPTQVPEPMSLALFGTGLAGIALARRARRGSALE